MRSANVLTLLTAVLAHPADIPRARRLRVSTSNAGKRRTTRRNSYDSSDVPAGLQRVHEGGRGKCMFHAIARQALGDSKRADRARLEVCDWMEQNLLPSIVSAGRSKMTSEHLEAVRNAAPEALRSEDDAEVLQYIQAMRCSDEWGSGLEAVCAAYCYGRPLMVWTNCVYCGCIRPPQELLVHGSEPIRLLHDGSTHWDSAVLAPGAATTENQSFPKLDFEAAAAAVVAATEAAAASAEADAKKAACKGRTTKEANVAARRAADMKAWAAATAELYDPHHLLGVTRSNQSTQPTENLIQISRDVISTPTTSALFLVLMGSWCTFVLLQSRCDGLTGSKNQLGPRMLV